MQRRLFARAQFHLLVSFFAAMLLAWPLLQIAAKGGLWTLWCYVFGVWVGVVGVAVAFARAINKADRMPSEPRDTGERS